MDYKIYSYLDKLSDAYKEPVQLLDGLTFDHKDTLRVIEFYSNDRYLSGNKDALGREKPFYNICNYRVTVAKVATDLDVKDIKYEPESLNDSVATMIINRELFKYLKETNFSQTLNDMGLTRPKYGGVLVKRCEDEGVRIDVVEWKNTDVDPVDIMSAPIIETHYMLPAELLEKSDVWDSYEIKEALKAHSRANKGKPARIEIKEVTGNFPITYIPDEKDTEENSMKYEYMCFYVACVNKKKFLVYHEKIKDIKDKYRYLAWDKIPGRALGRGIVEDGFEAQVWTNDGMITMKNAMELFAKIIVQTDSQKVSGNAITGVDHGHIFQLEPGRTMNVMNMGGSKVPELEKVIDLWKQQYDSRSSTYNANTGEAPTAGTPYSQTALLNQVANSPFEYQREVWGIFLYELLNDWILPELKRRIKKAHYLVSEFSEEELNMIDEAINIKNGNKMIDSKMRALAEGTGKAPTAEDMMTVSNSVSTTLSKLGNKREIEIPDEFLNIDGRITANITGELKNKAAVLQSLDGIIKTISASFNPNTGQYAALQDPTLRGLLGSIVELSGIPFTSAQLKASNTSPAPQADVSAVAPQTPVAGV